MGNIRIAFTYNEPIGYEYVRDTAVAARQRNTTVLVTNGYVRETYLIFSRISMLNIDLKSFQRLLSTHLR